MSGKPPSPRARLELFVALADEYTALTAGFPVDQRTFMLGGSRTPADRWHRLIRSFALRKFFIGQDHVNIGTVLDAVNVEFPGSKEFSEGYRRATDALVNGGGVFGDPTGEHVRAEDVVRDALYGLFLHGDYDKWQRAEARRGLIDEFALFQWTSGAETQLRQIRDFVAELIGTDTAEAQEARLSTDEHEGTGVECTPGN